MLTLTVIMQKYYMWNKKMLCSKTDSVKVCVSILRGVVVEHNVDELDVHFLLKQVGGDKDLPLQAFKLLEPGEPVGFIFSSLPMQMT